MKEHRPARHLLRPARPELSGARNVIRKGVVNVQDRAMDLREFAKGKLKPRPLFGRAHGMPDLGSLVERASRSRVGASREFQQFRACLEDELARDGGAQLLDELYARYTEELHRLTNVTLFGRHLAERFRSMDARRNFFSEVVLPAHRGQIDAQTAWNRTDALAGVQVRDEAGKHAPGWTIGIGGTGEAGAGGGAGLAIGLCGVRHGPTMTYVEGSVGAGARLEVEATFHIQFAPCAPSGFGGFSITVGGGAGYYVAGSVDFAFVPKFHRPSAKEPWLVDYVFDSVTVQVGAGMGADVSVSLALCGVAPLRALLFPRRYKEANA